ARLQSALIAACAEAFEHLSAAHPQLEVTFTRFSDRMEVALSHLDKDSPATFIYALFRPHGSRSVPSRQRFSGDRARHHRWVCLAHCRYGVRPGCCCGIRPRSIRNARRRIRHPPDEVHRRCPPHLSVARNNEGQTARLSGPLALCRSERFTSSARTYFCE